MTCSHKPFLKTDACGVWIQGGTFLNSMAFSCTAGTLSYQMAWKAELGIYIVEEDWARWSVRVHKGIINKTLGEANSKVYPTISPCALEAAMYHVWWSFSTVQHYWIRVFNLIYSITGPNIAKNAKTAFFF